MAEDDIVQRIRVEGLSDIEGALRDLGAVAAEAFGLFERGLGPVGEALTAVAAVVVGVGAAMYGLASSSSNGIRALEGLATQAGASVEDVSALKGALSALGASGDSLTTAFRILSNRIQQSWGEIQRAVRDSADNVTKDELNVAEATSAAAKAEYDPAKARLSVAEAELRLREANQRLAAARNSGEDDGPARRQAIVQATIAQQRAEIALKEAQIDRDNVGNKVEQAEQNRKDAERKRVDDLSKDIVVVAKAIENLGGETDKVSNKLIVSAANTKTLLDSTILLAAQQKPRDEEGGLVKPNDLEVLLKMADVFKIIREDSAAVNALARQGLGRGFDPILLRALQEGGSDKLRQLMQAYKEAGFAISNNTEETDKFVRAQRDLGDRLESTKLQFGAAFAPGQTQILEAANAALEKYRASVVGIGRAIAEVAGGQISQFLRAISGEHVDSSWINVIVDGVRLIGTVMGTSITLAKDLFDLLGKIGTFSLVGQLLSALDTVIVKLKSAIDYAKDLYERTKDYFGFSTPPTPVPQPHPSGIDVVRPPASGAQPGSAGGIDVVRPPISQGGDVQAAAQKIDSGGEKISQAARDFQSVKTYLTDGASSVAGSIKQGGDDFLSTVQDAAASVAASLSSILTQGFGGSHAGGGLIRGPGTGTSDSVLARVSAGEYVVRADGSNLGDAMAHFARGFSLGGLVGVPAFAAGGLVGHYAVDLRTNYGDVTGLRAGQATVDALDRAAARQRVTATGTLPSWYRR